MSLRREELVRLRDEAIRLGDMLDGVPHTDRVEAVGGRERREIGDAGIKSQSVARVTNSPLRDVDALDSIELSTRFVQEEAVRAPDLEERASRTPVARHLRQVAAHVAADRRLLATVIGVLAPREVAVVVEAAH